MREILAAIDWFLNTPENYQVEELNKRDELLALVKRELVACRTDSEREPWERRKILLEAISSR